MSILVIAEHDNQSLKGSTLNTVSAATLLTGDISLLVAGSNLDSVINECQTIDGISKILKCDSDTYKNVIAEDLSSLILANCEGYTHILAPSTTFGKNLMPRISAKLDTQQISDIISVESDDTFKRPIYAGSCIATVKSNDDIKVITVRSTAFDPITNNSSDTEVIDMSNVESSGISKFVSEELAKSDRPELTAANIVISGGRGMQSGDNFHLLDSIADKLGAAVGASRAAVDAGFVPNDYQVGQTGKIVAPDLYIAVGISGAIQHLAGMKDSKVIVAINKDEDAPIFQVADYGLVADLFNALPEKKKDTVKK
jgi:electron transfer flavoprotein alpha subunit